MIAGQFMVYVFDMLPQPTAASERALALRTDEPRARVVGPNVMPQPSLPRKHGPTITTRMVVVIPGWIGNGRAISEHVRG